MKKITAKYTIILDNPILVKRQDFKELDYNFSIDEFEIEIKLLPSEDSGYNQKKGEKSKSFGVTKINFYISCLHDEDIPPIKVKEGERDFSLRAKYFEQLEKRYHLIVKESFNRFISFFKYDLNQPLLKLSDENNPIFNKPEWFDEKGGEIDPGIRHFCVSLCRSEHYIKTGAIEFTSKFDKKLIKRLQGPIETKLYKELLSDAQTAFFSNNHRRAIIEMAIACEIAVKHKFFFESEKTGVIFNYLEDKNKINIRVLELIGDVAKYAYGKSFKKTNDKDFQNIDYLFRSRNKVAHRGEIYFKDDGGNTITPDKTRLHDWWNSIYVLFRWLERLK